MFYCGIDPGSNGGVALIDSDKKIYSLFKYDDKKFAELLCKQYHDMDLAVCVEHVHAIQGAKASSTFTFGFNVGKTHGIIISSGYDVELVRPQEWKQEFDLIVDGGHNIESELKKQASIDKAKELFPGVDLRSGLRAVKDHDGMAEALLIAEWLRRKELSCAIKK